jgi:CheY-like chemotaxis protein
MGPAIDKAGGIRVLIVEDDDDSREMLGEWVCALGHHQLPAANADEALTQTLESRPELALIDLGLPGVDGYEVARRLRAAVGGSIRLVALTGYSDGIARQTADAAGFDDFLVKPVLPEVLEGILRPSTPA